MKIHLLHSLLFLFMLMPFISNAQAVRKDDLHFKDRLLPVAEENIFKTNDYYNWGTSIIKGDDGKFHLFYSRWHKDMRFGGWLTFSEIAHAVSDSPAGPWEFKETALKGNGAGHWDAITATNPKIKRFNGKYYLYYISTNLGDEKYTNADLKMLNTVGLENPKRKALRENQRTGVAVSNSINGPWQRMDTPLIEPSGPITTITVNPAITQGKNGEFYLIVKGDKPNETKFIRNQAIAVSDSPTGPFKMSEKALIDDLDTEDMSLWYDKKRSRYYSVFHAHTFLGMMSSTDGENWQKATEYVLSEKEFPTTNGAIFYPDRMERPFVYVENDEPRVLAFSVKKGDDSFIVTRLVE